jgi:methionyl-tRNA formyltransferase
MMIDMRVIVLTTETPHHLYFVKEVSAIFNIIGIGIESKLPKPPFKTHHSFEDDRDRYEIEKLLDEKKNRFEDFCETKAFNDINDERCIQFVADLKPDVIVTFGTGLINKALINLCPNGFINLHGGDPEYYRGLDTNMWAIYHQEFEKLIVTLHRLNSRLDDGEIIQQAQIKLDKNSRIIKLRAENTKLCVQLTLSALLSYNKLGYFISKPQKRKGLYYSFMPSNLKEVCVKNFEQYIQKL